MKRLATLMLALCTAFGAIAQSENNGITDPVTNGAQITFENEVADYGTIEQGSDPYREFVFTNTGTEPLIITKCKGSCGCTVPDCPKEPFLPGESGTIKVKYDTKRLGNINKTITVTSNSASTPNKVIRIKGKVKAPAASPAPGGN